MSWRVKEQDVRDILETKDAVSIAPFLTSASVLTDRVEAEDADGLLSSAELEQIEAHLAAHFYDRRDPHSQERKTGDASAVFQGRTGLGLDGTWYGQNAKLFDRTGYLARLDLGPPPAIGIDWLGLAPDDQTDAVDRGY